MSEPTMVRREAVNDNPGESEKGLSHPLYRGKRSEKGRAVVLSFRGLQLQRIAALQDAVYEKQRSLAGINQASSTGVMQCEKAVDEALHLFATALRDYETLSKNTFPGPLSLEYDFKAGGELKTLINRSEEKLNVERPTFLYRMWISPKEVTRDIINRMKGNRDSMDDSGEMPDELEFIEMDKASREAEELASGFGPRLPLALFGSVYTLIPMIIMTLHQGRNTALITTCSFTIFFAVAIAHGAKDSTAKDVLAVTAAYTAILVIFVGSSLSVGPTQA